LKVSMVGTQSLWHVVERTKRLHPPPYLPLQFWFAPWSFSV